MALFIVAGTVLIPPAMWATGSLMSGLRHAYDAAAIIAIYIFAILSSLAVYEINLHDTVLTTEIHKLFMNQLFLLAGAYLGLYVMYRLIAGAVRRYREE